MAAKRPATVAQSEYTEKKIVIIGAGTSGLSAASQLEKLGFKNVLVLEAQDTIGGRVQALHFGSDFIEMGAQWIHGQEGNCLYEIAHENDFVDEDAPDYMICTRQWGSIRNKEHREAIKTTLNMLEEVVDKLNDPELETTAIPKSLQDYLSSHFENYLLQSKDTDHIKLIKRACYDWFLKILCEVNGCMNLSDVSCKLTLNYKECEGCSVVELKSSYSEFLKFLFKNVPEDWIMKNRTVETIIWSRGLGVSELDEKLGELKLSGYESYENHPIKIHCLNGEKYEADHAIITIPLGCLKESSDTLFVPPLPSNKAKAIQSIGFGTVNKIYLEFVEPFWEEFSVFNMLWLNDSFQTSSEDGSFQKCAEDSWYKYISRFAYVPHHDKMLCAWIIGDGAVFMESLPETQIMMECHKLLQQQLGQSNIPFPCKIIRTQWMSNPFSCGSYSYLSVDCEAASISPEDLALPIVRQPDLCPLLLFAGEATHPDFYSTVHGAYETGVREAYRIFDYYRYFSQNGIISGIPVKPECVPMFFHHQWANVNKLPQNEPKIVIIGAGAAGLSCAQRLIQNGFRDIIVLEAQNRSGGRIHTLEYGDSVLELGAQWVHGEDDNLLYEFSESHGLLSNPQVDFSVEGKGHFCTSSGNTVNEQLVDEVIMVLEGIKEAISSHTYPHTRTPHPVTSVFENGFTKYLSSCSDSEDVSVKKGIFNWYLRFEVIDNACDKLEEISTLGYAEWTECPGVFHINFKNGFESFVSALCDCLPSDTIKFSKSVKCVYWKNSFVSEQSAEYGLIGEAPFHFPVVIECDDGDLICADSVIITSSIGYLKCNIQNFFHPQLPVKKTIAIQNSGFGTINKIYLTFDKPFWTEKDLGFQLVWVESDDNFERIYVEKNNWVYGISGFDIVRKQPNTLVGWIGGPEAVMMEKVPLESVGKTCVDILRRFLNKEDIPYPIDVIRSSWNRNPYVRGSYSSRPQKFFDMGCHVSDLIEPLNLSCTLSSGQVVQWPAIMFAGEATDPEYFSSVHGAMRSGWREADRLSLCFRKMKESVPRSFPSDQKL